MNRRVSSVLAMVAVGAGFGWSTPGTCPAQDRFLPPGVQVVPGPPVVVGAPPYVVLRRGFDPYQDALGRLRSKHDNSRRDGAVTLGRIGDPRAVPDLVWLLQNDRDADVRAGAAFALGAIGDARAANALRWAASGDRNRKVRQAANHAFGKILFDTPVPAVPVQTATEVLVPAAPPPGNGPFQEPALLEPLSPPAPTPVVIPLSPAD